MRLRKSIFVGLLSIAIMSFTDRREKITVYLIGDSTMANKSPTAFPETGWGMPFSFFFDSTVVVDNRARNGRSTRTFISENLWQPVADQLKVGDHVFIQFGHNDESREKVDRYTTPDEYKRNLKKFVSETRARNAKPILITPVSRRKFDNNGNVVETHAEYSPLVVAVAKEENVPLIDLDARSRDLYQSFGEEDSKLLFLQLQPGEHPNYPDGKTDNTHFSELGARKIAQIVLKEIVGLKLDLETRIVKPKKKL